jgi:TonB family protein
VVLKVTVDEQGSVTGVELVRGHPLLTEAAIDSVRQWKYSPTIVNGQPTPVIATEEVSFVAYAPPLTNPVSESRSASSGETRTPRTTEAPTSTPQPPTPPIPKYGTLEWAGEVGKDQKVIIEGSTANLGTLRGKLPGVPCLINVSNPDVGIAEAPGPSNGYQKLVLRFGKKGRYAITIRWERLN